eukprot:gene31140-6280_t
MMETPTSACRWMVDAIAEKEPGCERSLMHRYDGAAELLSQAVAHEAADEHWALVALVSRNNCSGGMIEEWHQKLHNNTSPDDVVICEALLAYMDEGLNIKAYWRVLQASNITPKRLASYDRAIRSEPKFSQSQVPGLTRDLLEYLVTLRAVHSGADLSSASANVLGYSSTSLKGKTVTVEAIPGVGTTELKNLVNAIMFLQQHPKRLQKILFMDLDLDSTGRTALEGGLG